MATMNISLPNAMKAWVEQQVATGRYANASDYVRDVIRRDEARALALADMQREIDIGLASGMSDVDPRELRDWVRKQAAEALEDDGLANVRTG